MSLPRLIWTSARGASCIRTISTADEAQRIMSRLRRPAVLVLDYSTCGEVWKIEGRWRWSFDPDVFEKEEA